MDKETQKRLVREQRVGHEWYERFQIEEARKATFEDRVRDFNNILGLARVLGIREPDWSDDEQVTERWNRIRSKWDAPHR
jgi:uncharacterized membrane-anchored protein